MNTDPRRAASPDEDARLSRLYQQVTEQQAARFAAGYDMPAGLHRYQAWLDEHTVEDQAAVAALQASLAEYATDIAVGMSGPATLRQDVSARPIHVTETLVADIALGSVSPDPDADRAVTELYSTHFRSLVRLAALLVAARWSHPAGGRHHIASSNVEKQSKFS